MDPKEIFVQRRAEQQRRQEEAAARFSSGLEALRRLVQIAKGDTGQSRHVADFLLAWWNADACGGFNLTTLWAVDGSIADDMTAVFRLIGDRHEYPTAYDMGSDFDQMVARWRPELVKDN